MAAAAPAAAPCSGACGSERLLAVLERVVEVLAKDRYGGAPGPSQCWCGAWCWPAARWAPVLEGPAKAGVAGLAPAAVKDVGTSTVQDVQRAAAGPVGGPAGAEPGTGLAAPGREGQLRRRGAEGSRRRAGSEPQRGRAAAAALVPAVRPEAPAGRRVQPGRGEPPTPAVCGSWCTAGPRRCSGWHRALAAQKLSSKVWWEQEAARRRSGAATRLQARWRGLMARRAAEACRAAAAATRLQALWRGWRARQAAGARRLAVATQRGAVAGCAARGEAVRPRLAGAAADEDRLLDEAIAAAAEERRSLEPEAGPRALAARGIQAAWRRSAHCRLGAAGSEERVAVVCPAGHALHAAEACGALRCQACGVKKRAGAPLVTCNEVLGPSGGRRKGRARLCFVACVVCTGRAVGEPATRELLERWVRDEG
mmetsp:Transcript_41047/g.127172  ORF Transcript_41047/g.127172 Transcript_41047/m.127172 type:complete len:425 (+) Transcript_41047:173-1447(+)